MVEHRDERQADRRWVRALNVPPGHWKKQLPTKCLAIASKGTVQTLKALLKANTEYLNKRGNHGRTLLWEATRAGNLANVKLLLDAGADAEVTGCYNSETLVQLSPMCAAIHYKRPTVAAFLKTRTRPHNIFQAAFLGDGPRVKRLLVDNPRLLNADDEDNEIYFTPPLTFAVAGGHHDVTEQLLDAGADIRSYSAQLFHVASGLGRVDLLDLLLTRGADPMAADSSVFVAARDPVTTQWLLNHGVPVDRVGTSGFPPLVYLAPGG
ncbi:MAG: ankyrin repeat domain-containing protein [Deltaproteobacteria bacterium]|nr:ankyrin repeat domain-containing protein [Deltaproteobacteria bacterium]